MPKNRLIHFGALIVAASVLIWLGAHLTRRIEWIVPYAIGVGVALIVVGFLMEMRRQDKSVAARPPETRDK
jgi:hypothetical protein